MNISKDQIEKLLERINEIIRLALRLERQYEGRCKETDSRYKKSLRNFLHYLALGHHDIRDIQDQLSSAGISSLKNAQLHTLENLHAVQAVLYKLLDRNYTPEGEEPLSLTEARELLEKNTEALLGDATKDRKTRIMVTFSSSMAEDYQEVHDLVKAGMDVARINCAKDDKEAWGRMIKNVRKAEKETGNSCKILMDLAGPKIRTGDIKTGPRLIKMKVRRDIHGETLKPESVALIFGGEDEDYEADIVVPVSGPKPDMGPGDVVTFKDTRDAEREMEIQEEVENGFIATLRKNAFLETGMYVLLNKKYNSLEEKRQVGKVKEKEQYIYLKKGDRLILHGRQEPGEPKQYNEEGKVTAIARISISLPEVLQRVEKGHNVLFDDGKIEARVSDKREDELELEITYAKNGRRSLKADKGINFPESELDVDGLTEKDKEDLDFVAQHADVVNLSFVRNSDDVTLLQEELKKRNAGEIGIMLKIETTDAIKQLPWILMTVMQNYPVGVMIARGDLAVECGWVELARYQEEIQWMCQAAHIPDVWATQVLEGMAKKGLPKRAEVTDAARSQRAACVMLNKGDYIVEAIEMLDEIIQQVEGLDSRTSHLLQEISLEG